MQDADRLDAIGAIGIARDLRLRRLASAHCSMNLQSAPRDDDKADAYHTSIAPTINHFYEKLLLLQRPHEYSLSRDGWRKRRHRVDGGFFAEFYAEWGGER